MLEPLEERCLLTTFNVTRTTDDYQPGSLRAAIISANSQAGLDIITLPTERFRLSIPGLDEPVAYAGDLDISDDLIIRGAGPNNSIIDASGIDRVFEVWPGSSLTLDGVQVTGGAAATMQAGFKFAAPGGGILNRGDLTLNNCSVSGNTSFYNNQGRPGGGIASVGPTSRLTIRNCTIEKNVSDRDSAGRYGGAGIYNHTGMVEITSSTFSGNSAGAYSPGGGIANGGGYIDNNFGPGGTVTITNSTFSRNMASSGVAVFNNASGLDGHITILNSTITANLNGYAVATNPDGLTLKNSIIAGNQHGHDIQGSHIDAGHNLIGTDPMLGPLQDNGGPTFTHALLPGSPAIDAGDNSGAPERDQREVARPQNGVVDIGAYELVPVLPGQLQFDSDSYTALENVGPATLTVIRTDGSDGIVSVQYLSADGSAEAGKDYEATIGTLTFADGETTKTIRVPVLSDTEVEGSETVYVALYNPTSGATLGDVGKAILTIEDTRADVESYGIRKGRWFSQTNDGAPTLFSITPYHFWAFVNEPSELNPTVNNATIQAPNGNTDRLTRRSAEIADWLFVQKRASQGALDTSYPAGPYRFSFDTAHDGTKQVSLNLPQAEYPPALHIANWAATQEINSAADFTVLVDPAVTEDDGFVELCVSDQALNIVYCTSEVLESGQPVERLVIPAGTLRADQTYTLNLRLVNDVVADSQSYPGAIGRGAHFTGTEANIATINPAGRFSFGQASHQVREDSGPIRLQVNRTGGTTGAVTVRYATSDSSALTGLDYSGVSGKLTFADGESSKYIDIPILNDMRVEPTEHFRMTLSAPTGGAGLGTIDSAQISIQDTTPRATDVSSLVHVLRDSIYRDRFLRQSTQIVTLGNRGMTAIRGPIRLVLDYLGSRTTLLNPDGQTALSPPGSPYVELDLGPDKVLDPGEKATVLLVFIGRKRRIGYFPRVMAGGGAV